jgi:hypothetical protein
MTLGLSLPRVGELDTVRMLSARYAAVDAAEYQICAKGAVRPASRFRAAPIQPESLQKGVEWSVAIRDTMPRKSFADHLLNTTFNPSRPKIS